MHSPTPIRIARGFDDQGLWPALALNLLPLHAPVPEAWEPAADAPQQPMRALPQPGLPGAPQAGPAAPDEALFAAPQLAPGTAEPPGLVACLKLLACLVALGGAYLAGQFLWAAPATATLPNTPAGQAQLGSLLVKEAR
jgi:hypothetical protein